MPLLLLYVLFIESGSFGSSTNRLLHLCVCVWVNELLLLLCFFLLFLFTLCSPMLVLYKVFAPSLHCSRNLFYFILFFSLRFSFIASRYVFRFASTFSVSIKVFLKCGKNVVKRPQNWNEWGNTSDIGVLTIRRKTQKKPYSCNNSSGTNSDGTAVNAVEMMKHIERNPEKNCECVLRCTHILHWVNPHTYDGIKRSKYTVSWSDNHSKKEIEMNEKHTKTFSQCQRQNCS